VIEATGEIRLDADKLGVVRRAPRRCHRLGCAGASRRLVLAGFGYWLNSATRDMKPGHSTLQIEHYGDGQEIIVLAGTVSSDILIFSITPGMKMTGGFRQSFCGMPVS
jgi:hypothetical protein